MELLKKAISNPKLNDNSKQYQVQLNENKTQILSLQKFFG
jgi:hypothetical protein